MRRHLEQWLGAWPPAAGRLEVVGSNRRAEPGWDGAAHPVVAVLSPSGGVLSVPPEVAGDARDLVERSPSGWHELLPALVGHPDRPVAETVFRFTTRAAVLDDAGVWVSDHCGDLPDWLSVFMPEVLVCRDERGRYVAGVGIKRHDEFGHELAVGTEPAARGRGIARRLVAQAARAVVARGILPTYRHAPDNTASARVAGAAGFRDRGWRSLELAEAQAGPPARAIDDCHA